MEKRVRDIDILVIGGGASGCACACQAARCGLNVVMVEESSWVGGMITAAGVSAFDGNKNAIASGIFLEFRRALEEHYGGEEAVKTGWISDTCFTPRAAEGILRRIVQDSGAEILTESKLLSVPKNGNRISGAVIEHDNEQITFNAKVTVEATEYGDVLEMAGVPYRLGREAKSETGESHAPDQADMEVQDMTLCAILKKYDGQAPAIEKPANYDPAEFDCSVAEYCSTPDADYLNHPVHDFQSFITYASLPENKYLLNWPFHSNDSPDSVSIFGTAEERAEAIEKARQRTLRFVYFMQNELNHPEWGIAEDEFDTPDGLAYIPYVRESRRVKGVQLLKQADVLPPTEGGPRAVFQEDSIAIGDYFLDHHHSQEHRPPGQRLDENYPDNAPFQVPYGCLVPESADGLLVAEKSISVTHIVNGCSRLQPVVMLIGQAAGMAAALCCQDNIEPRELSPLDLQDELIEGRRRPVSFRRSIPRSTGIRRRSKPGNGRCFSRRRAHCLSRQRADGSGHGQRNGR